VFSYRVNRGRNAVDAKAAADRFRSFVRGEPKGVERVLPKVSVIVPVRDGERFLARAIDSALAQTYQGEVEIVVANDGSTDATAQVMERYRGRIVAQHLPPRGHSAARNSAIAASTGEFIAPLDADDEWLTTKLERTMPLFEKYPETVLAYHDALEVDPSGRVTKESYYARNQTAPPSLEDLLSGCWKGLPILSCATIFRREACERAGGYNENLDACEDICLWVLLREQGPFQFLREQLVRREFEANLRREEWYIKGVCQLDLVLRERYGERVAGNFPVPIYTWSGTEALLRGERGLAQSRYLEALRLKPHRLRTWARLFSTFLPLKIVTGTEHRLHGETRPRKSDLTNASRTGAPATHSLG